MHKFEKLQVYQLALQYADMIYALADRLPKSEEHNLKSQLARAATSIVLNIAEGSTGQGDAEQRRFLGVAIRSLLETVACQQLIERRRYVNKEELSKDYEFSQLPYAKLQALRRTLQESGRKK